MAGTNENGVEDFQADRHKMDKYSRQVGEYGLGVMAKMVRMKVLIIGLKGVGIEVAKNLVLAGVGGVTLYDEDLVRVEDLGTNFYLKEEHVGKKSVAEASLEELKLLNNLVTVDIHKSELNSKHVKKYSVVVDCGLTSDQAVICDAQCRKPTSKTTYLRARVHGVVGYMFTDFGDKFEVSDKTGEQPVNRYINSIESSEEDNEIIVRILADQRHNIDFDDHVNFVKFHEVEGALGESLNNTKEPFTVKENQLTKTDGSKAFDAYSLRVELGGVKIPKDQLPYEGGGQIIQQKKPVTMSFKSLQEMLKNPVHPEEGMLPFTDGTKFGRADQLHIALNGLWRYESEHKKLPEANDEEAINAVVEHAKKFNEEMKAVDGCFSVEELDEDIVADLARFAECRFQPFCCFFGGVVAQEVVKFAGKYTPLRQWLHLDCFEVLPEKFIEEGTEGAFNVSKEDRMPIGSRYDDMIKILGKPLHQKLMNSKTFMVGCGALGCEFLKNFALCGLACDTEGSVTVTDNDTIEVSNLSRQFLFREHNVGQPKSSAASNAVKDMNSAINIKHLENLVAPDTENIFNFDFWDKLDFVTNAVDNVKARVYVDKRCVYFDKPLLESGTLGVKCNSQVILPGKTQTYDDGPKDDVGDAIPLCTLRNFPSQIEHCIEWARAQFVDLFEVESTKAGNFLKDPAAFIKELRSKTLDKEKESEVANGVSTERKSLQKVYHIIMSAKSKETTFASCVEEAYIQFHLFFRDKIASLIKARPLDSLDSKGQKFWDKTKRFPSVAEFDAENEMHLQFVLAMANILSLIYGVVNSSKDFVIETNKIKSLVAKLKPPETKYEKVNLSEEEEGNNESKSTDLVSDSDVKEFARLLDELQELATSDDFKTLKVNVASFEKDDDTNFHIDFITATSNLRAWNYKLKPVSRHKAKLISGRIIPALATTTAAVTGLVMIELLKVIQPGKKLEAFKDSSNSLAVNSYLFMEPSPPIENKDEHDHIEMTDVICIPPKFNKWDKTVVKGKDLTLREFMSSFVKLYKEKFELDVKLTFLAHENSDKLGAVGFGKMIYDEDEECSILDNPLKDIIANIYGETALDGRYTAFVCSVKDAEDDEKTYKIPTLIYEFA